MSAILLDANVLIALYDDDHSHHGVVASWYVALQQDFATCPIVEGALVRWVIRLFGQSGSVIATRELRKLAANPRHCFWADDLAYASIQWDGVFGHKQVADAYLAALARKHHGRIATLDRGLAALHHDVAELISI